MGSLLIPLLANIILTELVQNVVEKFNDYESLLFYSHYFDNTSVVIKCEHLVLIKIYDSLSKLLMVWYHIFWIQKCTVEPVYNNHFWDHYNMVVIDRWLLYGDTASSDHLIKWLLCTSFLKTSACQI